MTFTLSAASVFSRTGGWSALGGGSQLGGGGSGVVTRVFTSAHPVATSHHGNVTVGTVPPGFKPTTGLVATWAIPTVPAGAPGAFSLTMGGGASSDWDGPYTIALLDNTPWLTLWSSSCGLDITVAAGPYIESGVTITGTYIIELWWWNSTTGDYFFGEDPGAGWVEVAYPTPVIDSLTPDNGPIAGGTAFTILGDGFLGPDGTPAVEGVIFDGEFPATSVVVVSQHQITGVTPAHWKGGVDVVVTLDFTP